MKRIALATFIIAALLAPAEQSSAYIRDRKLLAGAACAGGYNEPEIAYYEDGGIYSQATNNWWRTALCPFVNDAEWNQGPRATVRVRAIDRHYDLDINCRVMTSYTTAYGSTVVSWGPASSTAGSSNIPQFLTVQLDSYEPFFNVGDSKHLLCYLPPPYLGSLANISGVLDYRSEVYGNMFEAVSVP